MRAFRTAVLAAVLAGLAPAPASAWILIGADVTRDPGQIALLVWGSGSFEAVDVTETVDGTEVPVRTVVPPTTTGPDGSAFSGDYYPRSAQWRCDRLTRVFNAAGRRADGTVETASFRLRTPSCRNRLTLTAPRRVRPGSRVTLRVRDRFKLGGLSPRLCVRDRCRTVRIAEGRSVATTSFRPSRGRWRVTVRSPWQRLRAVVSAGVRPPASAPAPPLVLTTGDSLMQSTDAILGDRLGDRARVRTDVFIGSKISRAAPVDWARIPGRQLRRFEPEATVVFLGTNEGWPMTSPQGDELTCCGEPWIAEYARRARAMMRTYSGGGDRALVWLNVPIPRNEERRPIAQAVNVALARAVQGVERAAIVDVAGIFTPGGVYRDVMTDRGRSVRVREADGVHLSPAGASIAVRAVIEQLERFGVV